MDLTAVPAGSIVVGIDGSSWSDAALEWGVAQASLEGRHLTLLHAIAPTVVPNAGLYGGSGIDYGRFMDEMQTGGRSMLDAAVAQAHALDPTLNVHPMLVISDARTAMLDLGERAAMIVVGSRGRGPVASLLLGSVSVTVSKHAACPVIVVRPHEEDHPRHGILVGVDGSKTSVAAIEFAYRLASFRALPLTVLHGYQTPDSVAAPTPDAPGADISDERALVSESLAGLAEKFPDVAVQVRLARGDGSRELITASADVELLVVGHHRVSALDNLVHDSVAAAVVEQARCAVAVVPAG